MTLPQLPDGWFRIAVDTSVSRGFEAVESYALGSRCPASDGSDHLRLGLYLKSFQSNRDALFPSRANVSGLNLFTLSSPAAPVSSVVCAADHHVGQHFHVRTERRGTT